MADTPPRTETEPRPEARWLGWIDRFSAILTAVAAVIIALMMVNIVIDVVSRWVANRPLPGTFALVQEVWMPILVALPLGYALLRGEHIRVSLLTGPASSRVQRGIEIVGMSVTLVVVAMLLWFSTERAISAMEAEQMSTSAHWLAVWPTRFVLLLGLLGLVLQTFAQLWRALTVASFVPDDDDEVGALLESIDEESQVKK